MTEGINLNPADTGAEQIQTPEIPVVGAQPEAGPVEVPEIKLPDDVSGTGRGNEDLVKLSSPGDTLPETEPPIDPEIQRVRDIILGPNAKPPDLSQPLPEATLADQEVDKDARYAELNKLQGERALTPDEDAELQKILDAEEVEIPINNVTREPEVKNNTTETKPASRANRLAELQKQMADDKIDAKDSATYAEYYRLTRQKARLDDMEAAFKAGTLDQENLAEYQGLKDRFENPEAAAEPDEDKIENATDLPPELSKEAQARIEADALLDKEEEEAYKKLSKTGNFDEYQASLRNSYEKRMNIRNTKEKKNSRYMKEVNQLQKEMNEAINAVKKAPQQLEELKDEALELRQQYKEVDRELKLTNSNVDSEEGQLQLRKLNQITSKQSVLYLQMATVDIAASNFAIDFGNAKNKLERLTGNKTWVGYMGDRLKFGLMGIGKNYVRDELAVKYAKKDGGLFRGR